MQCDYMRQTTSWLPSKKESNTWAGNCSEIILIIRSMNKLKTSLHLNTKTKFVHDHNFHRTFFTQLDGEN